MSVAIVFIVIGVVGAFALARHLWPQTVQRWFRRIEWVRVILWTVIVLSFAFVLIASGSLGMVLVGAIALGYGVLYVLEQDLLDEIKSVLGI